MISFTRVARDQIASRCRQAGRGDLVQAPHFIGTFDSFIWEFLVKPLRPADPAPRLLESWSAVKAPVEGMDRTVNLGQIPLTVRVTNDNVQETVDWDLLDRDTERTIAGSARSPQQWEKAVLATRKTWCDRGYYTGHEARFLALRHLRSGKAPWLLPPVLSRFAEVVLDEAQDCSKVDLAILELLHHAGMPLVLVGDPDQAIYAWRGAEPKALGEFVQRIAATTIPLTGNRRSSQIICRIAATLRAGSRPADTAVIRHDTLPVAVFPTRFAARGSNHVHAASGRAVAEVFRDHARAHEIPLQQCLLTAHRYATLPGMTRERPNTNALTSLAWAHTVTHTPTAAPSQLARACSHAARVLLGYWFPDETGSPERICTSLDIPIGRLNRTAFAFLYSLPAPHKGWAADVWQAMKTWPPLPGASPAGGKGRLGGTPTLTVATADTGMRAAIVHQVKGDEADAVLLFLPDAGTAHRWATGDPTTDELLRIWYVALTRARRLAALAIPEDEAQPLAQLLRAHQVPIEIL